ncbi:MAG TPA: pantoate--beta-alanine ligase [Solirubrobacteraceae bacterium]|jgi:pantoate--beta-alanine ligase|nr:pantoate--beta-alanine ligase [Solirubrobacteraceae bacterium]
MTMRVLRSVDEMRTSLESERRAGRAIGLVPTMGALHAGHLSLIDRARADCDVVVVSLFVNPAQFNEHADLDRYPRQEERDRELAGAAGADLLFAPAAEEVYPAGFSTSVEVHGLTDRLEGAVRGAGHFRGVTTVVTKLLNIVSPDVAYFGQKDAQQAIVIRRMVKDLNMNVRIEACPTVREADGLAMSSRNAHLSNEERAQALAISRALAAAATAVKDGERSADALTAAAREAMSALDVEPEYVALVQPDTLDPVARLEQPALLAIAARVGETRLIDNAILSPGAPTELNPTSQPALHSTFSTQQSEKPIDPRQAKPREAQATCSA